MADFVLSPAAVEDIRTIYSYGVEAFGRAQADAYVNDLYERFALLAEFPGMGWRLDAEGHAYQRFGFGTHGTIFSSGRGATRSGS